MFAPEIQGPWLARNHFALRFCARILTRIVRESCANPARHFRSSFCAIHPPLLGGRFFRAPHCRFPVLTVRDCVVGTVSAAVCVWGLRAWRGRWRPSGRLGGSGRYVFVSACQHVPGFFFRSDIKSMRRTVRFALACLCAGEVPNLLLHFEFSWRCVRLVYACRSLLASRLRQECQRGDIANHSLQRLFVLGT